MYYHLHMKDVEELIASSWKLLNNGDFVNSTKSFKECYEHSPENLEIINGLAENYRLQNDHGNTIKFLNLSLKKQFSENTLRTLSWVYVNSDRHAEACQCFLIYLESKPDETEVRQALLASSAKSNLFKVFAEQLSYLLSEDKKLDNVSLASTLVELLSSHNIDSTNFLSKSVFNTKNSKRYATNILNAKNSLLRNHLLASAFELYNQEKWGESKKFFLEVFQLDTLNQEETKCLLNCCLQTNDSLNGLKALIKNHEFTEHSSAETRYISDFIKSFSSASDVLSLWPEIKKGYSIASKVWSKSVLQSTTAHLIDLFSQDYTSKDIGPRKHKLSVLVKFLLSQTNLEIDKINASSIALSRSSIDFATKLANHQPKEAISILQLFTLSNSDHLDFYKNLFYISFITDSIPFLDHLELDDELSNKLMKGSNLEDILNMVVEHSYAINITNDERSISFLLNLSDYIKEKSDHDENIEYIGGFLDLLVNMAWETHNADRHQISNQLIKKAYQLSPKSPNVIRAFANLSKKLVSKLA